jgi:hypothetical protein
MKVTVIGTGSIGLLSGACVVAVGNDVLCLDLGLVNRPGFARRARVSGNIASRPLPETGHLHVQSRLDFFRICFPGPVVDIGTMLAQRQI